VASDKSDGVAPGRRDRLGALMIRHPFWTAATLAVMFYLLMAAMWVGLADAGSVTLTLLVLVPVSIFYGAAVVGWSRRSPTNQGRVDADQLRQLRAAARAARQGRPVDLDPETGELLARQVDYEVRTVRRLRSVVPFVGILIALAGVIPATLAAWPIAILVWIVAAASTALVWWILQRQIRLGESLAEAGRTAASAGGEGV
jgi:hypothetical protein